MRAKSSVRLADLLVLSTLVLVLVGLLVPTIWGQGFDLGGARENARRASCMNNVRQIMLAMKQYATDHDDRYMPLVDQEGTKVDAVDADGNVYKGVSRSSFALLLRDGYLTTTKVFICPSTKDKAPEKFPKDFKDAELKDLILPEDGCSYGWDPTKTGNASPGCALIADKPDKPGDEHKDGDAAGNSPNHAKEGQNIAYNDGHVKWAKTPEPDNRDDKDIYKGDKGYESSDIDAKIIR